MGHIDPGTGRNKRETGKLIKRMERGSSGGQIKRRTGRPIERRIDQKRRQKLNKGNKRG